MNRRNFIKTGTLIGSVSLLDPSIAFNSTTKNHSGGEMKLKFYPYTLELKHVFTIANFSRSTTPVMIVELEHDGIVGYGEASMPPYLGESHETATNFFKKLDFSRFTDPFLMNDILDYVASVDNGNHAAKAAIDIALHDLIGKKLNTPYYKLYGINPTNTPYTSFTIGIDTAEVIRKKVLEADQYKILKVKLGRDNDKEIIETIRSVTDKTLRVDANQGWKTKEHALEMMEWLAKNGIEFVEQPMSKEKIDDHVWLKERSPIPIVGDESVVRLPDVKKAWGVYHGINIKLMKCTGIAEAYKMIQLARALDLKIMIGCMTETSCAISAASLLSPLVDWADLDGADLISNDLFDGAKIIDGKVTLTDYPGIGIKKR